MKILGWNCRGMLSNTAVRELLELQERTRAELIFLSESHLNKCKADELRRVLGFDSMFVVESDGWAGGLVLFYHK
uniref:Endonuclease/exonuclease/phosphatase domain-containing protein n=1 Tax=Triticum urartu TaxID=4572 RepID=A0A8R7UV67_TRIUA